VTNGFSSLFANMQLVGTDVFKLVQDPSAFQRFLRDTAVSNAGSPCSRMFAPVSVVLSHEPYLVMQVSLGVVFPEGSAVGEDYIVTTTICTAMEAEDSSIDPQASLRLGLHQTTYATEPLVLGKTLQL